jgi:tetrahydromethanopterin S-methyltransferase subunit C
MGFLNDLLQSMGGLFGTVLSIAGVVAFILGTVIGAIAVLAGNWGGLPTGCAFIVGGIVAVIIGTILGRLAARFSD